MRAPLALQGWVALLGVVFALLAFNFFMLNVLPARRRKRAADGGEKIQYSKKRTMQHVALVLAESFLFIAAFFSLAFAVSLNSTLLMEGDHKALGNADPSMYEDMLLHSQIPSALRKEIQPYIFDSFGFSHFPDAKTFPPERAQIVLYDRNWKPVIRYDYYVDYRSRVNSPESINYEKLDEKDWIFLNADELLSRTEKAEGKHLVNEEEVELATLKDIKISSAFTKAFAFLNSTTKRKNIDWADKCDIRELSLRGLLERTFKRSEYEFCVKVLFADAAHYDALKEADPDNKAKPLAFGEKDVNETLVARPDICGESGVFYLYSRCRFSQLWVAYHTLYSDVILMCILLAAVLGLFMSVSIQSLLYYNQERERLERQRDLLIFVAHELKTPMGTAKLYAEKIERSQISREDALVTSSLQREITRMRNRLNQMLTYAKIDDNAATLRRTTFLLGDLLEDISDEYVPQMEEEKKISFDMEVQPDIEVYANNALIEIAVSNFLSNAVKFTPRGGEIKLTLEMTKNKRARVSVYNSGSYISEEDRRRIWHTLTISSDTAPASLRKTLSESIMISLGIMASRPIRIWNAPDTVDSSAETKVGTGFGLPIVQKIISSHGGWCDVDTTQDGVVFWFEIPTGKEEKKKRKSAALTKI